MIESLVSVRLPADEELTIKKNRLTGVGCEDGKRIAVVTGIHGDELEGQYVCYELVRLITANMAHLKGTVDIYPSINPLGMESVSSWREPAVRFLDWYSTVLVKTAVGTTMVSTEVISMAMGMAMENSTTMVTKVEFSFFPRERTFS